MGEPFLPCLAIIAYGARGIWASQLTGSFYAIVGFIAGLSGRPLVKGVNRIESGFNHEGHVLRRR